MLRALGMLLAVGCASAPPAPRVAIATPGDRTIPAALGSWGTARSGPLPDPSTEHRSAVVPDPEARCLRRRVGRDRAECGVLATNPPPPRPVPATLDDSLRRGWTRALALGVPDPRHGTPHEVEIFDSSVWSTEPEVRSAIGFVLPHEPGERPFALIGSLVYPLVSLGPPVDLREVCAATLAALERLGPMPDQSDRMAWFEGRDAAWRRCPGLQAALVLADTEPELANALGPASSHHPGENRDVALVLVGGLLAHAFERAVTAHMRGDDAIARHDAQLVARVRGPYAQALREAGVAENELTELDYLAVADELARDQDRRAAARSRPPLPELPEEGEVPAYLVPLLVDHLDEVQVGQGGQPGGVPLGRSPIVQALVRAGGAAVPALIDAVEHDARLTRSVHFWRDFVPPRTVLGVHEAAYSALVQILGASFFEPRATGDNLTRRGSSPRAELAARLRTYWERYGQHAPAERRYRVLAAADASPEHHVEAAAWITSPEGQFAPPGSMVGIHFVLVGGPPRPLAGEALREGRDPSVTELLARRMDGSGEGYEGYGRGCAFARALARWSPAEAPDRMVTFARRCAADGACSCAPGVVGVVGERETSVLERYAARVRAGGEVDADALDPVVRFADRAPMRALLEWLLDEGPFAPARAHAWQVNRSVEALAESGALELAAVRPHLARALAIDRVVGTLEPRDGGRGWVQHDRGGFSVELPEPAAGVRTVRVRDLYARALSTHLAVPFSLGWDSERRDEAIAAMRARLVSTATQR